MELVVDEIDGSCGAISQQAAAGMPQSKVVNPKQVDCVLMLLKRSYNTRSQYK